MPTSASLRCVRSFFLLSGWILASFPASACKYNVRDAGFVDWNPQPYHLYCFVDGRESGEFTDALRHTAAALFLDANVEFHIVNASQTPPPESLRHARAANLSHYPGLVLVSSAETRLLLGSPPADRPARTAAWDLLERVVASPARDTLLQQIVDAYAVVVLIEGEDSNENRRARNAVNDAVERVVQLMDKLPKAVKGPPVVQTIPADQARRESVLLWSLGIGPDRRASPNVAVLYGRGRRMGPTLAAPVSADQLYQTLAILGQDCECSLDRSWMTGPMIPASWDAELQRLVHLSAGFDAENPLVKTEISRIMARGPSSNIRPVGLPDTGLLDLETLGYSEITIEEPTAEPLVQPAPEADAPTAASSSPQDAPPAVPPPARSRFSPALLTLAGLVGFVMCTCAALLWRARRSS